MDLSKEVEYRLAKWIFANIYHKGIIDEKTYHQLLNRLLDECNPPMRSARWENGYIYTEWYKA